MSGEELKSTALPPIVSTDLSLNASPGKFEGNGLRFGKGNDVPWNRREIVFGLHRQSVKVNSADLRREPSNFSNEQLYTGHDIHRQLAIGSDWLVEGD
jgi:hypothetical protein